MTLVHINNNTIINIKCVKYKKAEGKQPKRTNKSPYSEADPNYDTQKHISKQKFICTSIVMENTVTRNLNGVHDL